jgi:uncharacterized protein with ParB-like and HNH nuclease domain
LEAKETTLKRMLEGEKQFLIPLFQREYRWGVKQWNTLWNDLLELYNDTENDKKEHFMASVVTLPIQSKPEGVTKFLVIDGQQRLTTFYIILAVIRDYLQENKNIVFEIDTYYLFNMTKDGSDKYKFLPTKQNDDQNSFIEIMNRDFNKKYQEKSKKVEFKNQIEKAYNHFYNCISHVDADRIKTLIFNRITLVSVGLNKDEDPYKIFESLNGKGAPLTQADLIRNYFLMKVNVNIQDEIYKNFWDPMQISLNKFDKDESVKGENCTLPLKR